MPNFSVVIDEQGIHANKIFVPWDNIAAISPITIGLTKVEVIGIYPRDFHLILRQSSMNAIVKTIYRWMVAYGEMRGIPHLVSDLIR